MVIGVVIVDILLIFILEVLVKSLVVARSSVLCSSGASAGIVDHPAQGTG